MEWWELVIGAAVLTLLTVLVTGPGLWSSSWGWRSREGSRHERRKPDR